jgi:hypothetical protein
MLINQRMTIIFTNVVLSLKMLIRCADKQKIPKECNYLQLKI